MTATGEKGREGELTDVVELSSGVNVNKNKEELEIRKGKSIVERESENSL